MFLRQKPEAKIVNDLFVELLDILLQASAIKM